MLDLDTLIYVVPAIIITVTLHELAHGWVSYKFGDPTPKLDGRLSLNPLQSSGSHRYHRAAFGGVWLGQASTHRSALL